MASGENRLLTNAAIVSILVVDLAPMLPQIWLLLV